MGKIRIHELSKNLGKPNKEILAALEKLGITGKTHSSAIDEDIANKITAMFKAMPEQKLTEKPKQQKPHPQKQKQAKQTSIKHEAQRQPEAQKPQPHIKPFKPVIPEKRPVVQAPADEVKAVPVKPEEELFEEKVDNVANPNIMKKAFNAIRKLEHRKFAMPAKKPINKDRVPFKTEKFQQAPSITAPRKKSVKMQEGASVKEFSELIGIKIPEAIKKFMELGYMTTINQPIDTDAAMLVADALGVKLEIAKAEDDTEVYEAPEEETSLSGRPPIVTIMGHVDHGKTSLLDAIRQTRVMDSEAGGITQHIGAYKVFLNNREIVFLDTPGHEAFTALRARGAKVTDIVVLVVAADDGVKPQTIEAIDHAKAAGVPIIVAVNKIDKPEANVQRVKTELAERGIAPEEWGGQNIFAEISAKKKIGLENLLELILLQADMMELKANPGRLAKGVIIESRLDKGRGPVATAIVQTGTLNIGDIFITGVNFGRVRALVSDDGGRLKNAGPSSPVEIIGFNDMPTAGDTLVVVEDEKKARQIASSRLLKQKSLQKLKKHKLTLDELYSKIKEGNIKELNIIIKGDVQGSVEAIKDALEGITHKEVSVRVIHTGVGGITESDVMLAAASNAIIIGFNVRPELKASHLAEKEAVDIEMYNIIYEAIDDVKKALEGMLEPTVKEKILGRAEVRQVFQASRIGNIAGCYVIEGTMNRNSDGIRVIRDNIVVYQGRISTLKRFKDDVKEVQTGYECGITIENFNDIKTGDVLENFINEKIASKL